MMSVNGTELFVTRHGRGLPVLIFHGGGFDHTIFRRCLDPLAQTRELIYFDQRGSGRSRRDDLSAVTDRTWVEDADAIREALGLEQLVVFGHSYGGCLAQEYALAYPQRTRGLILCGTTPAFDYPAAMMANAQARATPQQFDAILNAFSAPVKDDRTFREAWTLIRPVYFHRYDPNIGEALTSEVRFSAAGFNRVAFHCLPAFNTLTRLSAITAPALVLAGASDWITPPDHGARRLIAGITGSSLGMFDESGHFPFAEEPERFLSIVDGWLRGLE